MTALFRGNTLFLTMIALMLGSVPGSAADAVWLGPFVVFDKAQQSLTAITTTCSRANQNLECQFAATSFNRQQAAGTCTFVLNSYPVTLSPAGPGRWIGTEEGSKDNCGLQTERELRVTDEVAGKATLRISAAFLDESAACASHKMTNGKRQSSSVFAYSAKNALLPAASLKSCKTFEVRSFFDRTVPFLQGK